MSKADTSSRLAKLSPAKQALLEKRLRGETPHTPAARVIVRRAADGPAPLSSAQRRLWFLDRLTPGSPDYVISGGLRLRGRLDVTALGRSLDEVVRRHHSLRTRFVTVDDEPAQVLSPHAEARLETVDLSSLAGDAREAEVKRLAEEFARRPFDLEQGPPYRASLLRLGEEEFALLFAMHHIVSDGWSVGIFVRELTTLYEAFAEGRPSPLEELPVQYADYAAWQRERLRGEALERGLAYWREQLGGGPPMLELPADRPRLSTPTQAGARQLLELPAWLTERLNDLGRQEGATLFMTLLAAFKALLYRYTRQEDIVVGSPVAGRNLPETEPLIGCFINMLVLRTRLSGAMSFRELLRAVKETALGGYRYQDVPFERLVEELNAGRSLTRNPLFEVVFALHNFRPAEFRLPGVALQTLAFERTTARYDFELHLTESGAGLKAMAVYNADLFEAETVGRLLGHFRVLLEEIVARPDKPLSELDLITEAERKKLLIEYNDTRRHYPRDAGVHQLFEAQAERTPDAVAVEDGGERLTYRELNERANQLARYLRAQGVGPEVTTAILLERSVELIVSLLAALKAGGAYMALDASYPPARLDFMLRDVRAPLVVTTRRLAGSVPAHGARVVCLDAGRAHVSRLSRDNLGVAVCADNLAYVIYTSGSTGRPKGVGVTHRGVARLVVGADYARFAADEVWLQLAPVTFDASTLEIWGSLLHGARLALGPASVPTLEEIGGAIRRYGVTSLWLTAGLFHLMVDERPEDLHPLRQLLAGGDVLSVAHVEKFLREAGGCALINGYGPTENTTFTCCHRLTAGEPLGRTVPIGTPIANTQVYILDERMEPTPTGAVGELYIGGDGLARGYLNRPALTAERFVPDPSGLAPGGRLYRSGDLARRVGGGRIEFVGRADGQVKVRGFRVELGEIESVLKQHDAVRQCVVEARADERGEKSLVAYVVPAEGRACPPGELRTFAEARLPRYMLPSAFVTLDALPLTPNGKVDRRALPAPGQSRADAAEEFVAPRDMLEARLAKIWGRVLGGKRVGVRDDFFEAGGHSLLAVRLFQQIEREFGKTLPLATLFHAPTVERLADILRREGWEAPWTSLVPIQPYGPKPPVYGIHGIGGNILLHRSLAPHLPADQPFYGLQSQGLDGKQPLLASVEEMAAHYIKEIRELQPSGPYYFWGFSFGGVVAFEMGRQLLAQGERVGMLGLLDTYPPFQSKYAPPPSRLRSLALTVVGQIYMHVDDLTRFGLRAYLRVRAQSFKRQAGRLAPRLADRLFEEIPGRLPENLQRVWNNNGRALRDYVTRMRELPPGAYPGRITYFAASETYVAFPDTRLGWGDLAGDGLEVHLVPGNHVTITKEPHVRVLAEKMAAALERARAADSKARP